MQMKRIIFEELDKNHADLILKLRSRGLTQKKFFQYVVRAFIDDNSSLKSFFDTMMQRESRLGKKVQKKISRSTDKGRRLLQEFDLTEEEKSNIFDILEVENFDT